MKLKDRQHQPSLFLIVEKLEILQETHTVTVRECKLPTELPCVGSNAAMNEEPRNTIHDCKRTGFIKEIPHCEPPLQQVKMVLLQLVPLRLKFPKV